MCVGGGNQNGRRNPNRFGPNFMPPHRQGAVYVQISDSVTRVLLPTEVWLAL